MLETLVFILKSFVYVSEEYNVYKCRRIGWVIWNNCMEKQ